MKTKLFFITALFCLSQFISAQLAREAFVNYNKENVPAAAIDFQTPASDVTDALQGKMKQNGYSPKSSGGFLTFSNVANPLNKVMDFVFKVDKTGKNTSTVYLFALGANVSMGMTGPGSDMDYLKQYLTQFSSDVTAYLYNKQIGVQASTVTDAEKKLSKLVDQYNSMQKSKQNLESKMADNLKAQEKQKAELDAQRQKLNDMKTKQ